ncbi:MAG TPA: alpha/beta fold hydrolase [Streptosporangiaceae bacterium]|jgi:pimeloyl-ACP methyl ester carboxylesterase/predicted glycosyltransferase
MRARYPDIEGFIERDGVKVGYEVYGEGDPAVVFTPMDALVHARAWKGQVPYLARTSKVVTIDPRGNGRSGRPTELAAYAASEFVADTIAVMDAAGIDRAVLVGLCTSGWRALLTAALHPDRVLGVVSIASVAPFLTPPLPARSVYDFEQVYDTDEGWAKETRDYWLRDWRGYAEFFFGELLSEPHSTRQHEDCVGWAMETTAETVMLHDDGPQPTASRAETEAILRQVRCPVLAIHGTEDRCEPVSESERVAELTDGELLLLDGAGHVPMAREPVVVNQAIRRFVDRFLPPPSGTRRWTRPLNRPKRVLYVSSPIGLGHARRDLAIADELRKLRPGLEVHWLAQHPVTELLRRRSELIHPASAFLASESGHIESEAAEHDLHAFQAVRRMDEILVSNFMVFAELVADEPFDLWVGDEAWDVDYFLHENPELKRAPYAWLTDFVGWLPMPDGGTAEQALTADYNAEMIEQIARFPRLRDQSVFVGNPADVVPGTFGDGLPAIGDWVGRHYRFSGYVSGFEPAEFADRDAIRAELGYRPDEKVCLVTVGGSGVGGDLLRRVVAAFGAAKRLVPGLRMVVVTGPRIDPASLPAQDGLTVVGYVHDLYRHLAVCDLAVVQGGLSTTMELTASQRPFIYVPLRHHFEQNFHVRHRLGNYGAGRCLDYEQATPDGLAQAIADEIGRPVSYRPVETDGAARAAASLAELI